MASAGNPGFGGGDRFEIRRRLGAGGMGVVYEAFDRERGERVALKTLRRLDPAALYRFKREFRALADISHPNLVGLHELFSTGDEWYFTMELIEGRAFLEHVHVPGATPDHGSTTAPPTNSTTDFGRAPGPLHRARPVRPIGALVDLPRLRSALAQLAQGVHALHEAGRLHRDLKPANVLVTGEGRVVICDFGLVAELDADRPYETDERRVIGTAAYMSPEQAAGLPLSDASDWYSVGVILFEALTGARPFPGGSEKILRDKQLMDAPAISSVATDVPDDLQELCDDLLRRRPEVRPPGAEILSRLGVGAVRTQDPRPSQHSRLSPFVARGGHVGALREALAATRRGNAVTVRLHGSSGIGKTELARRFVDEITAGDDAVVLAGRCYERESVPYKSMDSLMDSLSAHLIQLPRAEVDALMPRDILALARLFPVLRRVEAVAEAPVPMIDSADLQGLRSRAFGALRELLRRLAATRGVVLYIDDLQWGDVDSAMLLTALMRPPDPPPILLLACFRIEEQLSSPSLKAFLEALTAQERTSDVRDLSVGPLTMEETCELAADLLGGDDPEPLVTAASIAREAGGNPFFTWELVRHVQQQGRAGLAGRISLREMLQSRLAQLSGDARRLLELIAVAAHPLPGPVALSAAGLETRAGREGLAVLRADHLVRSRAARGRDEIETYHDRIREAVVSALPRRRYDSTTSGSRMPSPWRAWTARSSSFTTSSAPASPIGRASMPNGLRRRHPRRSRSSAPPICTGWPWSSSRRMPRTPAASE